MCTRGLCARICLVENKHHRQSWFITFLCGDTVIFNVLIPGSGNQFSVHVPSTEESGCRQSLFQSCNPVRPRVNIV